MTSDTRLHAEEVVDQLILARRDAFAAARDLYLTVVLGAVSHAGVAGEGRYDRSRPVFVQFLNPEVLACYGYRVNGRHSSAVLRNALTATRVALLSTDRYLVFPSSYIFEVAWFDLFLADVRPLVAAGHIRYTSPGPDLGEYRESKLFEYRNDRDSPYRAFDPARVTAYGGLPWTPRPGGSTAVDIGERWKTSLMPGGALHGLVRSTVERGRRGYTKTERNLAKIPGRLAGQAFIKRFVEHLLPVPLGAADGNALAFFLSAAYLESYVTDLNAMMLVDFPFAALSCGVQQHCPGLKDRLVSVPEFDKAFQLLRIHEYVYKHATWDELLRIRSSAEFGVISSAIGDGFALGLMLAILVARKESRFRVATSYQQAMANLAIVADQLTGFVDRPGKVTYADTSE